MDARTPVALLPPEVSRRIAAGEVIERPASVIRELIDNSLDADADEIDISWEAGGAELLRVADSGGGMHEDDLRLCWKPHATSKIRSIEDLDHATTLGFRGEALGSVAAVSDLQIRSAVAHAEVGHALHVRNAELLSLKSAPPHGGTIVEVRRLFANLPARRRFLSRAQAETAAIRNVIHDKALPFPAVRFSHQSGESVRRILPAQPLVDRVAACFGQPVPAHSLHELNGTGEGFAVTIVAADPAIVRRDRRLIQVFVNRRRVWEYKLVQAVEYAYQDVQHGGLFPAAAVLVEIDPELVDFNIHPAKREVRIRSAGEVHHRIVEVLRSFLRAYVVKTVQLGDELWQAHSGAHYPRDERSSPAQVYGGGHSPGDNAPEPPSHDRASGRARPPVAFARETSHAPRQPFGHEIQAVPAGNALVYRGTLFGTFIIVERAGNAWIIDQHAAHERILYDRFAASRSSQRLLVPVDFETTEDEDAALRRHREEYASLGIELEEREVGSWQLTALPTAYRNQTGDLIETIRELGGLSESFDRTFLAEMACKAALKAGDYLDDLTALELAERTLALDTPRCPHGRPLWMELSRERLEKLIGRR